MKPKQLKNIVHIIRDRMIQITHREVPGCSTKLFNRCGYITPEVNTFIKEVSKLLCKEYKQAYELIQKAENGK